MSFLLAVGYLGLLPRFFNKTVGAIKMRHILVVEDNDLTADLLAEMLSELGCTVEIASTGKAFLDKYQKAPAKYNLIFMDGHLPDVFGTEPTKQVRRWEADNLVQKPVSIIGLTAHIHPPILHKMRLSGMNEVFSKPISYVQLQGILEKYMK